MLVNNLKILAKSLLIVCLFNTKASAIENNYSYSFTVDKNMSSISSADFAMSAIEGYKQIDDNAFAGDNDKIAVVIKIFTRVLSSSWIMVANHEVGGHGARAREYKLKSVRYTIRPFDGATNFSNRDFALLHPHKQQSVNIAGIEANYILSEKIKTKMIESDSMSPVYAINYIWTRIDQITYIAKNDNGDVASYIKGVNDLYQTNLSNKKLLRLAYIDLLDPFLGYSLYSFLFDANSGIPMFEVNNVKYLPAAKLALTPYGTEARLINHFKINDKYYKLSLGYGSNKRFNYYSLMASADNILKLYNTKIGFDFAFWRSPKMLTSNPINAGTQKGGMLVINTESPLVKNISLIVSAGYKTAGFIEGMPLKSSGLLRAGLKLNF